MARAVAPAWRNCIHELAIAVDPPVPCTLPLGSKAKFPYIGTFAGALSPRIWLHEASSSSATIVGSPVQTPCPASTCLESTVTVLSGSMCTKGMANPGAATPAPSSAPAARVGPGNIPPRVKPAPAILVILSKSRRLSSDADAPAQRKDGSLRWRKYMVSSSSSPAQPRVDVAGRVSAASWVALRMRAYVAQRQMLPAIAASISASEGLEFVASNAAADITCPLWQYPHCGTSRCTQAA